MILALLLAVMPYVDEDCAASFSCISDTVWELVYQDQVIPLGDMTQEQCVAALTDIEPQTRPFSKLICRPRLVEREDT
jgi:hypothetical protein